MKKSNPDAVRKDRLAKGIPEFFKEIGMDIKGLKVLDVGCSSGFHADVMRQMGADVWINDLDTHKLKEIFPTDRIIICPIGNLPKEYNGKFNVVTAFRVFSTEGFANEFYHGIASAMNAGGKGLIGIDGAIKAKTHEVLMESNFKNKKLLYSDINPSDEENIIKMENQHIYMVSEPLYVSKPFERGKQ